jgi:prophage DNA circulation protein
MQQEMNSELHEKMIDDKIMHVYEDHSSKMFQALIDTFAEKQIFLKAKLDNISSQYAYYKNKSEEIESQLGNLKKENSDLKATLAEYKRLNAKMTDIVRHSLVPAIEDLNGCVFVDSVADERTADQSCVFAESVLSHSSFTEKALHTA